MTTYVEITVKMSDREQWSCRVPFTADTMPNFPESYVAEMALGDAAIQAAKFVRGEND